MLTRILIAAVCLLTPLAALAATPAEIAARAAASVERSAKWDRVEVQRAKADDYALAIWYKRKPANYAEVERDTKALARAVLKTLSAAGQRPAEDRINVFTRGRMAETGETGKLLVRVFGRTSYDYNSDQLAFERNK